MKYYCDDYVVCPFHTGQFKQRLQCEGISKDCRIHLYFKDNVCMQAHKDKYCRNIHNYENCPLFIAIEIQYEEDDND